MSRRWRLLAIRVAIATLVAWFLATVPIPLPRIAPQTWFAFVQVPIVVFGFICYIGKLMIDTLFYDHYKS